MNFIVLCDFDGTITEIDTAEFVLTKFAQGDWKVFDKQLESGEITLEECLRKQFSLVAVSRKRILEELKNTVIFRPHFEKLARYCKENFIRLIVVSAGLDFVIKHFLELKGWQELVEIYTAKTLFIDGGIEFVFPKLIDKTSADFKHDLVRRQKALGKKVIYIGDGSGDYRAAEAADHLFVIKDSILEKSCKNNRIRCKSITDFQEVIETTRKIQLRQ